MSLRRILPAAACVRTGRATLLLLFSTLQEQRTGKAFLLATAANDRHLEEADTLIVATCMVPT